MKLYEVGSRKYVKPIMESFAPPGARPVEAGETVFFDHIDGMYSFCKDKEGNIVHLPAWQEVEVVDNW